MAARVQTLRSLFAADTANAEAGFRKMAGETARFQSQTAAMGQAAGGVFDGLGVGVAQFAGPAGIGLAVAGIGKALLSLEQMREESAQLEARFVGFTGSTQNASAALQAFDQVLGNALTRDEKMRVASQLLGLGLASNAQDAALLTQQAMTLGIELDQLTQAMETGRVTGLVQYGFSVTDLRKHVDELKQSTADLTDTERMAIAIKEQLAQKSAAVAASGGQAVTATKAVGNAWEDLKDTIADKINFEGFLRGAASAINTISSWTSGEYARAQAVASNLQTIQDVEAQIAEGRAILAQLSGDAYNAEQVAAVNAEIERLQGILAQARVEQGLLKAEIDGSASSMLALGDNANYAASQLKNAATAYQFMPGGDVASLRWAGMGAQYAGAQQADINNDRGRNADILRWAGLGQQYVDQQTAANKTIAKNWQTEMQAAARAFQSDFLSAMNGAIDASKGLSNLLPGGGDPNAPGANGFAENIYRLQAFIKDGSWGATAQQFGLDQAGATDVVKRFQSGQWDASVLKVLDMGKLKEQITQQQVGKQMMDALVADLAKETQGDPKLIKAMLGMSGGSDGAKGSAAAVSGMDLSGFTSSFLASVDTQLKDNKADYEKRGENMWDVMGEAFVTKAGKSAAFARAVTRLVDDALANALKE